MKSLIILLILISILFIAACTTTTQTPILPGVGEGDTQESAAAVKDRKNTGQPSGDTTPVGLPGIAEFGPQDFGIAKVTVLSAEGTSIIIKIDEILEYRRDSEAAWKQLKENDQITVSVSIAKVVSLEPDSIPVSELPPGTVIDVEGIPEGTVIDVGAIPIGTVIDVAGIPEGTVIDGVGVIPSPELPPGTVIDVEGIPEGTVIDVGAIPIGTVIDVEGIPPETVVEFASDSVEVTGTQIDVADLGEERISDFVSTLVGKEAVISMNCADSCESWFEGRVHEILG